MNQAIEAFCLLNNSVNAAAVVGGLLIRLLRSKHTWLQHQPREIIFGWDSPLGLSVARVFGDSPPWSSLTLSFRLTSKGRPTLPANAPKHALDELAWDTDVVHES